MSIFTIIITISIIFGYLNLCNQEKYDWRKMAKNEITLPEPRRKSNVSLEEAIAKRRSIRDFKDEAIGIEEVSQLLWSAQGITDNVNKFRTAPSAGALYPLEVYIVIRRVKDLDPGVYKYLPHQHKLVFIKEGDISTKLVREALWQDWIAKSSIIIVISAIFERTTVKYGKRGIQYVYMEAGHSAQNVCLQAVTLGFGTTTVGAFNDEGIKQLLNMKEEEIPIYILPIGIPK